MLGTGFEQDPSLLVEDRRTQNRLQLVPAPPGVLPDGTSQPAPHRRWQARPLMCESGDHATLSRRCSVRVHSLDLACLSKVVAPRAADSSHLLHRGGSPTGSCQLAPHRRWQGRPLMCESGDHATLSRRCSVRVSSKILACLSKVVALRTASSSYLLHQECSWMG